MTEAQPIDHARHREDVDGSAGGERRYHMGTDALDVQLPKGSSSARLKSQVVRELVRRAVPPSVLVTRGSTRGGKRLALTFDDGPDELTPRYLEACERLGVRATFFVLGRNAEKRPDLVRALVAAGHEVASHGFSHRTFPTLSVPALVDELVHTSDLLPPSATRRPLVRPPKGSVSVTTLLRIALAGFTTVLWSLDSDDCRTDDPNVVAARCSASRVRPGEIVLLHEGQSWTLAALPRIVGDLSDAGYTFTTVGDLVA